MGTASEEGPVGEARLRGDNRNDPVRESLQNDPGIQTVLEKRWPARDETMEQAVCDAIQSMDERKLCGWVAVAVWENEDGTTSHMVVGDGHSSPLELKGFLHDGVWEAAHSAR